MILGLEIGLPIAALVALLLHHHLYPTSLKWAKEMAKNLGLEEDDE